jgi:hypothetical protein
MHAPDGTHQAVHEPARAAHGWKMCHERRQRQQLDGVQIDAAPVVEIDTEAPAAYIRVSQNPADAIRISETSGYLKIHFRPAQKITSISLF